MFYLVDLFYLNGMSQQIYKLIQTKSKS